MNGTLIDSTLDLLKQLQQQPLQKSGISTGLGLVAYDLEPQAKMLYPVLTPIRNTISRFNAQPGAGLACNWKTITAINTQNTRSGVSEGNRGAAISLAESNKIATYKGFGLENYVTFEAEYAGRGFDDVKALATLSTLQSMMIQEEITILNGNTSLQLGVTPTPTAIPAAGGTIPAAVTNYLYCVALTYQAYSGNNVAGGLVTTITKTNADGTTDTFGGGTAQISAPSAVFTTTSGNGSVVGTVAAVKGAFGYAWFLGVTAGAANAFLAAITASNSVTLTAVAAGTQAANFAGLSADNSTSIYDYDGLITQALTGGGYYKSLDFATLTADGTGGVQEIDTALKYFWDVLRVSPSRMRVGSQLIKDITKKVVGTSSPGYRFNLQAGADAQGKLIGANLVTGYLNKFALGGSVMMPIDLHPNLPDGMIFFDLETVPYPNANVPEARRIRTRQEYYQIEWPLITRKWQYGVYQDSVLQCYFPQGMGVLTNIAPG